MEERILMMLPQLNEMQKRLFLASEAISIYKIPPFEQWNYKISPT